MKAKTLIELLTLSTNIYMITKDEKLMSNLSEMTQKGKVRISEMTEGLMDEDGENLLAKLKEKAQQAKEELEHKIAEMVEKTYAKMNIAHTNQVKELVEKIEALKRELALVEARVINSESGKK